MANYSTLFCFLVFLFYGCFAQLEGPQQTVWRDLQEQQQHRLRAKTPCNIQRIKAQQPNIHIPSEAGLTELWDSNNPEFECAGVEVERKTIQPQGLLLPHYSNAPRLYYVLQGRAIHGAVIPGCAETFESFSSSQGQWGQQGQPQRPGQGQGQGQWGQPGQGQRGQQFTDKHQKLRRVRQGDILAVPAGYTHWTYNDGEVPFVFVAIVDVANEANQLDLQFRNFFLAGNSQQGQQGQQRGQQGQQWQQGHYRNIFTGFDDEILANAFNLDPQIIQRLKGQQNPRGSIVRAENLQLSLPEFDPQERQRQQQQQQQGQQGQQGRGGGWNGLEETICTQRLRENIAHPARADLFNPRAGRLSTVTSQTLPVLNLLQLSAEHINLYSNALVTPHWTVNAHTILYIIRGSGRIQVVGDNGTNVFDDQVNQGQLIIVPQNFAVIKKAGNEGIECIAFKTNANAMTSALVGRLSTIRAIPEDILASSYRISREDARRLKYGRQEATLLSGRESQGRRESA